MFDIDGTLTETSKIDAECFAHALIDVFGFSDIDTDWSHYLHTTDSGIFREIFTSRSGQPPTEGDTSRFREHFIHLLASASSRSPFAAVSGADTLLLQLTRDKAHRISFATGCWPESARVKMASVGMSFDAYPSASADDALDRETIITLCVERAGERFRESFACTIYVGDGIWDARACRTLGLPFIGVGSGHHATRLVSEGAVRVFEDFSDSDLFLATIDKVVKTA
jgi:phosphoglycolate phosphatase-like HAD superfamily hydrolase